MATHMVRAHLTHILNTSSILTQSIKHAFVPYDNVDVFFITDKVIFFYAICLFISWLYDRHHNNTYIISSTLKDMNGHKQ